MNYASTYKRASDAAERATDHERPTEGINYLYGELVSNLSPFDFDSVRAALYVLLTPIKKRFHVTVFLFSNNREMKLIRTTQWFVQVRYKSVLCKTTTPSLAYFEEYEPRWLIFCILF